MGLFTPIVKVDDDRENFGWILEILNKCPSTEELEQKLAELYAACKRAEDAKATINTVLNNATAAAKTELREEIQTVLNQCKTIQNEVAAAKTAVQKVVDDAVELAKTELQTTMQTEIGKAENAATRAETVVENLRSENALSVQTAINEELVRAKNELDASVQTKVDSLLSEIELAKTNLQTLINNKTSELNTAINNKLTETKQLIESENKNAVDEVKSYINTNPFYKRGAFTLIPENWINFEQTVSVPGVAPTSDIIVTHAPGSFALYIGHGVHLLEVESGLLRFACESVPGDNINVNVMILLRGGDI